MRDAWLHLMFHVCRPVIEYAPTLRERLWRLLVTWCAPTWQTSAELDALPAGSMIFVTFFSGRPQVFTKLASPVGYWRHPAWAYMDSGSLTNCSANRVRRVLYVPPNDGVRERPRQRR